MSPIADAYACKPCSVVVHKLSAEFVDDALKGRIKWKGLFKGKSYRRYGTDTESFIRSKLAGKVKHEKEVIDVCERPQRKPLIDISEEPEEEPELNSPEEEDEKDKEFTLPTSGRQLRARKPRKVITFTCKECDFTTSEQETLLLHSAAHKSVCDDCNLTFENKFKYQLHVYETHEPPVELTRYIVYGCKVCHHFFDQETDAYNHLTSHANIIEGGKYACALCRSTYFKEASLNTHLTTKHISYKCTFCDFLGSSFDILERHSLNTHAAYGKPYPCNLCDFRSSTFGALSLHRKHNHALEDDGNIERCRLCFTQLESEKQILLEHLISHVDHCLISCNICDYRCNSFQLMTNHGLEFHGLQGLDVFANLIDPDVLSKYVKAALDSQYGSAKKKGTRSKPTCTETNMAIAGISASGYMGLDPIMDSPVKVVPMESSALNIQGVMADQDPFLGGYSVLHTPLDPMISFSNSVNEEETEQNDLLDSTHGFPMQVFSNQSDHMNMNNNMNSNMNMHMNMNTNMSMNINSNMNIQENVMENQDHSDPQTSVTVHPSCDPLGMAFESTVSHASMQSQIPIPSEGILSVDPETGQLFLQGYPVFDEKGQAIYVAIHESVQPNLDNDSIAKNVKDCVQTANEESTEPVPNGDIS